MAAHVKAVHNMETVLKKIIGKALKELMAIQYKDLNRETRCQSNYWLGHFISTPGHCPNSGDLDSPSPEAIELYRCHLSHYNWYSRVGPLIL